MLIVSYHCVNGLLITMRKGSRRDIAISPSHNLVAREQLVLRGTFQLGINQERTRSVATGSLVGNFGGITAPVCTSKFQVRLRESLWNPSRFNDWHQFRAFWPHVHLKG